MECYIVTVNFKNITTFVTLILNIVYKSKISSLNSLGRGCEGVQLSQS